MSVIINDKNAAKVEAILDAAEHRCTARRLSLYALNQGIELAEQALYPLPKALRVGARAVIRTGEGPVANAYRGVPYETVATVVRRATGWAIEGAERVPLKPTHRVGELVLSEDQGNELLSRILEQRRIRLVADR